MNANSRNSYSIIHIHIYTCCVREGMFCCYSFAFSHYFLSVSSVHPSGCVNVVAVWLKLGGSILTSLWSYPYLWVLWISLLKAFAIHCGNKWEQLDTVSPEANLHLKILELRQGHPHITSSANLKTLVTDSREMGLKDTNHPLWGWTTKLSSFGFVSEICSEWYRVLFISKL